MHELFSFLSGDIKFIRNYIYGREKELKFFVIINTNKKVEEKKSKKRWLKGLEENISSSMLSKILLLFAMLILYNMKKKNTIKNVNKKM